MPELPEVESVRRSLAAALIGRRVLAVSVRRRSVVRGPATPDRLLVGTRVRSLERHGKQLLLIADPSGPAVAAHLGMTGWFVVRSPAAGPDRHDHVVWSLEDDRQVAFNDPRRFGGIWTFSHPDDCRRTRWSRLGPDALLIEPDDLADRLARARRPIKAALLDQSVVAGLGNIYTDELLFSVGVHPMSDAATVARREHGGLVRRMVQRMRAMLACAIEHNGSTLSDGRYADADGNLGGYQSRHQVYARSGLPCVRCGRPLTRGTVGGRTTVSCTRCQRRRAWRAM